MRMRTVCCAALMTGAVAFLAGCGDGSPSTPEKAEKVYDVTGKVVAVDRDKKAVELDHEDIPGLMKAMTMEFKVADEKLLDGLAAGDAVAGKLKVQGSDHVLTELKKR
jgi:Cu/Ag efflux protein CusF